MYGASLKTLSLGLDAVDGYSIFKLTQYEPNDPLEPEIRTMMMFWETFYDRHTAQHQLQWRQNKF